MYFELRQFCKTAALQVYVQINRLYQETKIVLASRSPGLIASAKCTQGSLVSFHILIDDFVHS